MYQPPFKAKPLALLLAVVFSSNLSLSYAESSDLVAIAVTSSTIDDRFVEKGTLPFF